MSLLAWIVLGLIAGFIGSKIVNNTGQGLIVDILLGVVGAVVVASCSTSSASQVCPG